MPDFVAGGAVGYSRTNTSSTDTITSARVDTYAGALYATWMPGALVFDARLAAGPTTGTTSRSIVFPGESTAASGSVNGWGILAAADADYRFSFGGATVKPFVGLTAQNFRRRSFTETTDFGLSFDSQTFHLLTSEAGLWTTTLFHYGLITIMPQVKLSWTRDLRDDTLVTQAALLGEPFAIAAAEPGRDAAVAAVNVAAWQTENLQVFASYTGEFRSNASSHQAGGGLRFIW